MRQNGIARETDPLLEGDPDERIHHGSSITTGAVINGPATKALTVYEVREVEGSIRIRA